MLCNTHNSHFISYVYYVLKEKATSILQVSEVIIVPISIFSGKKLLLIYMYIYVIHPRINI